MWGGFLPPPARFSPTKDNILPVIRNTLTGQINRWYTPRQNPKR